MRALIPIVLVLNGLAACANGAPGDGALPPAWLGIETRLLDQDMVNFRVAVRHADGPRLIEDYAACAAAQYALIRGMGFARHVRTSLEQDGATVDAETTVRDCGARGIPTV